MRVVQKRGEKGSLKWIQKVVNQHSDYLNRPVREACALDPDETIEWVSPREEDDYAEYRDAAFLDRLGVELARRPLNGFWPNLGPQWDALGRTSGGTVLLVEAKANILEVVSPACKASEPSKRQIQQSLRETQEFLKVDLNIDWSGKLYQYANRLAHLYLLRHLNQTPAYLMFVYFVQAADVKGPGTIAEWEAALSVVRGVLGIGEHHRLSRFVFEVFIPVNELQGKP